MKLKWKKLYTSLGLLMFTFAIMFNITFTVNAANEAVIKEGIFVGNVNISGMNKEQAMDAVNEYVESVKPVTITLLAADNHEVQTTAEALGIAWANPEIIEEALTIGSTGNIVQRYKTLKDLQYENKVYSVEWTFDINAINNILIEECAQFDQEPVNYSLLRKNNQFTVVEGTTGYSLDVESSIDYVYNYLTKEWNQEPCQIALEIGVTEPAGSAEELATVEDVLGTFTTSFSTSGRARSENVTNGCELVNGITVYPGEEFSTYEAVSPFTEKNGYYMAGSYLNGKVVDSLGGGICQVSTTLYNTVLNAELEVTERHNHSMIVGYVDPSADAAIAESAGKDFKFINTTDYPIYIEGVVENKKLTFTIYGNETRDSGRVVTYVSEVIERTDPPADTIYADATQPIGYIITESAHIGYKAKLWKVVTENGVEVSRTQVNSSSYKMVPRSATIGTATADPAAYNEIMAAIGTASIDHVKNVIAILQGQTVPTQEVPAEQTQVTPAQ